VRRFGCGYRLTEVFKGASRRAIEGEVGVGQVVGRISRLVSIVRLTGTRQPSCFNKSVSRFDERGIWSE
jgi:hypothetical protein